MRSARYNGLQFELEDGQEVIVDGNVSVYERGGSYQLYAQEIRLNGIGELYVAYEMLKQKLYEEGLFDHEIKKPIPKNPKKIGVVTARTGAAIHDIISTAKRRNPYVQLVLYPAKVQEKVHLIRSYLEFALWTSMELIPLSSEEVGARSRTCGHLMKRMSQERSTEAKTPIISGTGHEVDTTIADYAADLRAATPTAACELAVPDITEVMEGIANREYTMAALLKQIIRRYQMKLQKYQITIANYDPRFQL